MLIEIETDRFVNPEHVSGVCKKIDGTRIIMPGGEMGSDLSVSEIIDKINNGLKQAKLSVLAR